MKKCFSSFAAGLLAVALCSCNNSGSSGSASDSSSNSANGGTGTGTGATVSQDTSNSAGGNSANGSGASGANGSNANNNTAAMNATPLSKEDSTFVMNAAAGGMEEVEMGNLAQQQATSQRVKDFGAMMVRDHTRANDELKQLASRRGINIPAALPASKQKELDNMKKMTGKSFDQHYVDMMVNDHKKDVNEFKKQSTSGKDNELKTWAGQTLPVLQTHLDSIQAIKKTKM
jgi:putative membrane protein